MNAGKQSGSSGDLEEVQEIPEAERESTVMTWKQDPYPHPTPTPPPLALLEGPTFPEVSIECSSPLQPPTSPPPCLSTEFLLLPDSQTGSQVSLQGSQRQSLDGPGMEAPPPRLHCGFGLCPQPGPLLGAWRPSPVLCSLADKDAAGAVQATQRPTERRGRPGL